WSLRAYPRDGFSSATQLFSGIIQGRYAAPTPFERTVPNPSEANKRRNCHSSSIDKVTGCASPANASGFVQVPLSAVTRPVTILSFGQVPALGPSHSRSRLATTQELFFQARFLASQER